MTDRRKSNIRRRDPAAPHPAATPAAGVELTVDVTDQPQTHATLADKPAHAPIVIPNDGPSLYHVGDLVELVAMFTDPQTGMPVAPRRVTCHIRPPRGVDGRPLTVEPLGDGRYAAKIAPNASGTWWYAFDAEGHHQAAGEKHFVVHPRRVPR
jgi:hypothetical protein